MSKAPATKVFVVDDEPVIATTLAVILKQNGFAATPFTNPLDALSSVCADTPDLLISDVVMPQLTGIELAIQVRARRPECKILLFSGQAETVDLLEGARKRGHDFHLLTKPIHPTDLLNQIRAFRSA